MNADVWISIGASGFSIKHSIPEIFDSNSKSTGSTGGILAERVGRFIRDAVAAGVIDRDEFLAEFA